MVFIERSLSTLCMLYVNQHPALVADLFHQIARALNHINDKWFTVQLFAFSVLYHPRAYEPLSRILIVGLTEEKQNLSISSLSLLAEAIFPQDNVFQPSDVEYSLPQTRSVVVILTLNWNMYDVWSLPGHLTYDHDALFSWYIRTGSVTASAASAGYHELNTSSWYTFEGEASNDISSLLFKFLNWRPL